MSIFLYKSIFFVVAFVDYEFNFLSLKAITCDFYSLVLNMSGMKVTHYDLKTDRNVKENVVSHWKC